MSAPVRILGMGGSVRAGSINKRVLEMMLAMAGDLGAETRMADVHSMNLPIFNQDIPIAEQPEKLLWLIEQMKWADGFIICSPTYLGSLSGALKNMLDSLHLAHGEPGVYFDGRPVALASFGYYGQMKTINSLVFVTRVMGATIIPHGLTITADEGGDNLAAISTDTVLSQMRHTVYQLVQATERLRDQSREN